MDNGYANGAPMRSTQPQSDFASQIPAEYQHRVDPNSPIQKVLMQRVGSLGPSDLAALDKIPDAAVDVLKRLLPEVDFLLDQITKDGDDNEMGESPQEQAAPVAPPTQPSGPMSRLGRVG